MFCSRSGPNAFEQRGLSGYSFCLLCCRAKPALAPLCLLAVCEPLQYCQLCVHCMSSNCPSTVRPSVLSSTVRAPALSSNCASTVRPPALSSMTGLLGSRVYFCPSLLRMGCYLSCSFPSSSRLALLLKLTSDKCLPQLFYRGQECLGVREER